MSMSFGATSTTDEVLNGVDLRGRRVLITGVSAGLGVETARTLVAHGASVVGAARNLDKARAATETVAEAAWNTGGRFELIALDLADLGSVRACADSLLARGEPFDLIVNNAGVMATPEGRTVDGHETQFGTNHLGHFVLANRLARLLGSGGRLVCLSSSGHRYSDVDLDDPNFDRSDYEPWAAYGRSKTANVLFAVAFDRRHRDRGVRATAVHPGGIMTELSRHIDPAILAGRLRAIDAERAARGEPPFALKSVAQGAATTVWAGFVADADQVGGRYCEDCQVAEAIPVERPVEATAQGVRPYALDPDRATALWSLSEALVGERFD